MLVRKPGVAWFVCFITGHRATITSATTIEEKEVLIMLQRLNYESLHRGKVRRSRTQRTLHVLFPSRLVHQLRRVWCSQKLKISPGEAEC